MSWKILPPAPARHHQELLGKLQTTQRADISNSAIICGKIYQK
jgi:hypothetical protein